MQAIVNGLFHGLTDGSRLVRTPNRGTPTGKGALPRGCRRHNHKLRLCSIIHFLPRTLTNASADFELTNLIKLLACERSMARSQSIDCFSLYALIRLTL